MGGFGSGKWYRWNTKETTEGLRALDVCYLNRNGLLQPGKVFHLQWSRNGEETGTISGVAARSEIVLLYRSRPSGHEEWEDVREMIHLDWTSCNYGGHRPWFRCPGTSCGRRVAVLYGADKLFLCRQCYRLTYATRNMDVANRAREKAWKILKHLGGSGAYSEFIPKPKGMHLETYHRLFMAAHEAEMASLVASQPHIDKMGAWIRERIERSDR